MTNNKVKVGIVGLGYAGKIHLEILSSLKNVCVLAVSDRDQKLTRQIAIQYNATPCFDFDSLLSSGIEVLYVCTPNAYHAQQTLGAIASGIHVFSEKPMALNLNDARRITMALNEKNNIKYSVGFNRRFSPVYRIAHELLRTEKIEPYVSCVKSVRGGSFVPPWVVDAEISGGFLYDSLVHVVDLIEYLLGSIDTVYCVSNSKVYKGVMDEFVCIFSLSEGNICSLVATCHATWSYPWERFEIIGKHSCLSIEETNTIRYSLGLNKKDKEYNYSHLSNLVKAGYEYQDKSFVRWILGTKTHDVDQNVGLRSLQILEAMSCSATRREPIEVKHISKNPSD